MAHLPKTTFCYIPTSAPKPKNLEVSNITSSGATLTWIAPSGATPSGYQYQYKSTGGWPTDWDDVNGLTVTLNTLSASSDYTFRVRAIYDVGASDPIETTFTTPCEVITVDGTNPYAVNLKANTIAVCWSQTEGTYPWSFSSTNGATFSTSSYDEQTSTKLISPVFSFGEGSYWLSFTGKLYGDHYDDNLFTSTLTVYYRTSSTGEWQQLEGQSYTATGTTRTLDESEIILPAGTCQLAFEATSEDNCYAYLYGIGLTKVPCLINTYEVTATADPAEGGTVTGGGTHKHGTSCTLTATPNTGYHFVNWKENDTVVANAGAEYTFTVTSARTLEANFAINTCTLTLKSNPSNGNAGHLEIDSVDHALPAGVVASNVTIYKYIVDYGTTVKVNAIPAPHHHLASWNNINGNDLQQEVTMTSDMEITGVFAIDTFTLTLKTNDKNKGTVEVTNHSCNPAIVSHDPDANGTRTYKVNYGAEVIIKATANVVNHYHLASWSNGATVNQFDTIHVAVIGDSVIMANFGPNTYHVTLNTNGGTVTSGDISSYTYGEGANLPTNVTRTGYTFDGWFDNANLTGNAVTNISNTATGDTAFWAKWTINSYTLTVNYKYADGTTASATHTESLNYNAEYSVASPAITGYTPDVATVTGTMPAENLTVYAQWYRICDSIQDQDGNKYASVNIGNKCWMAANMRATHYADGCAIPNVYEYQSTLYPNVTENVNLAGRLYDWYAAMDVENPTKAASIQGICPNDWRMPTAEDAALLNAIPSTELRTTTGWVLPNSNTNSTGFSAYPAGFYNSALNRFEGMGTQTDWWMVSGASVEGTTSAGGTTTSIQIPYYCDTLLIVSRNPKDAISVRCVKD